MDGNRPICHIIRGLPGAGKSTLAARLGCLVKHIIHAIEQGLQINEAKVGFDEAEVARVAEFSQVPFLQWTPVITGEAIHPDHLVAFGDQPLC